MNLILKKNKRISQKINSILASTPCIAACIFLLALSLTSCINDEIPDPNSSSSLPLEEGVLIDLPGFFTVNISNTNPSFTRADENSNSFEKFDDGHINEYSFAPGGNNHFILLYKKSGKDSDTPTAVFPLSTPGWENLYPTGNITLQASSVVTSKDMWTSNTGIEVLKKILEDSEPFVLLNFDCSQIFSAPNSPSINKSKTNAANLYTFTRAQLSSLLLSDYKISVENQDYFTMSTSVFVDSENNLKTEYKMFPDNVYDSKYSGEASPAIEVYVERLAVKYTVKFEPGNFSSEDSEGEAVFKGDGYFSIDPSTGLPLYQLTINEYTDFSYSNQGYSVDSKPVTATVRVIGYYVNNTEKSSYAIKKIPEHFNLLNTNSSNNWNSIPNFRCYWSEDPHYVLESNPVTNIGAKGYPHQFRQALDSDTILQLHGVDRDLRIGYKYENGDPYSEVQRKIAQKNEDGSYKTDEEGNIIYDYRLAKFYTYLGEYDLSKLNTNCVLKYWSFKEMSDQYNNLSSIDESKPFYSLENTFYDPGMKINNQQGSSWVWEWQKASYSAATNITLLCELIPPTGVSSDPITVYRGQNNVFYYNLYGSQGLLDSKLKIFNEVILNQGNAGLNILHAYFASHGFLQTGDDMFDNHSDSDSSLEKVAWNEGSVLWIGEVEDDGTETRYWEAKAEDLTLIPCELKGGDGQCLIAPKYMGPNYKFYLAPIRMLDGVAIDDQGQPVPEGGNYRRDYLRSVEVSFNHLVSLIHKGIGPIDVFTDGKMYYSMPIPHHIKLLQMTGLNPSWESLGNIGVVRNNWYEIKVANITDVGMPVQDVNQPIVPVMDVKRNYINVNVSVFGWHTMTQQDLPMQ